MQKNIKKVAFLLTLSLTIESFSLPAKASNKEVNNNKSNNQIAFAKEIISIPEIDNSFVKDGYIKIRYTNKNNLKMKLAVKKDKQTYYYNFNGKGYYENYPLQMGDGKYTILLLENIKGNEYTVIEQWSVQVKVENKEAMYSISNNIVNWENSEVVINKAKELTKGLNNDEAKVKAIYNYVISNIKYDKNKLNSVEADYIPEIDSIMNSKKGICYDFASTFAGMLRSINIPAKLVMGDSKNVNGYHAWNEVLINGKWVVIDTSYDSQAKQAKVKYTMSKLSQDYMKEKVY